MRCGFNYDVVNAVLAADADDVVDAVARARSGEAGVLHMPEFRVDRSGLQAHEEYPEAGEGSRASRRRPHGSRHLPDSAEKRRAWQPTFQTRLPRVEAHRQKSGITSRRLLELSTLRPSRSTHFFDKVMVMVDDERVRANRLALLQTLLKEFSTIADFSEIVTEGKESKESSKQ